MESTILSGKMIKVLSPTPPSLRHHNLSFMNNIFFPLYMPSAFFFPKPQNCNKSQISHILENSLSKVLSFYYPFAGQIKDNRYVDCNDMGAEYLNVEINCPMSEILNHPYNDVVDVVFPQHLPWSSPLMNDPISPLVVQLSHFDCGGIAVSACLSHKIADGYSFSRFLNDWACIARDNYDELDFKPSPQFNASTFFPPLMDDPPTLPFMFEPHRNVSRIYKFSSSSLARLKEEATNSGVVLVHNPTRIEVATALVHKCVEAVSMEKSGVFKPSLLNHVMNLRPPIPLDTMANATCFLPTTAMMEHEIKLPNFVAKLQKAKQLLRDELKGVDTNQLPLFTLEQFKEVNDHYVKRDMFDVYICSSVCNVGLNKIDFGWGRPVRVTGAKNPANNNFIFMDEPSGDGINVLITLTEADMSIFQSNKELLQFASPVTEYSSSC